jgi:hypothetical protein
MKWMITCKQATEFIIKREEGKLPLKKHVLLWLHIGICGLCKLFASQSKLIGKNCSNMAEHVTESLTTTEKEALINTLERQ